MQSLNSAPYCLFEIQTTSPLGHQTLTSALQQILVVTMPRGAETLKGIINMMTYGTDIQLVNFLDLENGNLTHNDVNSRYDQLENLLNIHHVLYDALTTRVKLSTNGQLSHCSWSLEIHNKSCPYKMRNSMDWQIALKAKIGLKLEVTATLGLHSMFDWYYLTMLVLSRVPDYALANTVIETNDAEALYSTV